jgi:hypothetical protein
MAECAPSRDAWGAKTETGPTISAPLPAPEAQPRRQTPDPWGRFAVRDGAGEIGVLKAVLPGPRLLLLDPPQARDGVLLVPFDAIEQIRVDERTILLRTEREAFELAIDATPQG